MVDREMIYKVEWYLNKLHLFVFHSMYIEIKYLDDEYNDYLLLRSFVVYELVVVVSFQYYQYLMPLENNYQN